MVLQRNQNQDSLFWNCQGYSNAVEPDRHVGVCPMPSLDRPLFSPFAVANWIYLVGYWIFSIVYPCSNKLTVYSLNNLFSYEP